nr:DUF1090 family protein [Burkholderia ambifaria]
MARRASALQTQIDYVKQHGNTRQAMHQQAALEKISANCTDAGQLARAVCGINRGARSSNMPTFPLRIAHRLRKQLVCND